MLKKFLNQLTAAYGVLYIKLHQYHWMVQGHGFFTLHEQFEKMYDEVAVNMDDAAERLLQLQGVPVSSLSEFVESSWIMDERYKSDIGTVQMVENIYNDYRLLQTKLIEGIKLAGDERDEVTADLLVGLKKAIDKTLWMLKAWMAGK